MKKYQNLVRIACEKIPFQSYLLRLGFFIRYPHLGRDSYAHQNQREYALLDIFNGLALLAVIVSLIVLYDRSFNEFKIIIAFNPLFIVFSWVSNALVYSIVSASLLTALRFWLNSSQSVKSKISSILSTRFDEKVERDFYIFFTHGLRCFAAFGLLLGLVVIKAFGSMILEGQKPIESLGAWYWQLYVFIVIVGGAVRLLFYPYVEYFKFVRFRLVNVALVVFIVAISFEPIKWMPFDYTDKLIDQNALCELFKNSDFLQLIPKSSHDEAINKVCTFT